MNKIFKTTALILSCALIASCISIQGIVTDAAADETASESILTYTYEGTEFTYELTEDESGVVITGVADEDADSTVTELVLPDAIDDLAVTEIGEEAFYGFAKLTSITLPETLEVIGDSAFYSCVKLTSIELPDDLSEIGSHAFYSCMDLQSIDLPDGITAIESYTFYNCEDLVSVDFPDSLRTIATYAFYGCDSLEEVLFPDSLTMVYTYAFNNCSSINYIRLPASDASILTNNFAQSTSVETIEYAEGTERPYTQDTWETDGCFVATATTLILPSTLNTTATGEVGTDETATNDYFVDFESLETIIVSEDNENFASYDGCIYSKDLTELYICAHGKTTIEFPEGLTTILRGAFVDCSVESVILPDSVTTIEGTEDQTYQRNYGAFRGCTDMKTLYVPEGTSIGEHALAGLTGLTDATVYVDGVQYHFSGEEGLSQLEVSDSSKTAESITADVYDYFATSSRNTGNIITTETTMMSDLETIIIPASTTSIETEFFDDTDALLKVQVDSANTVYFAQNGVLYKNADDGVSGPTLVEYPGMLSSVELADGVAAIGDKAFYNCSVLKNFEFPSTVVSVGAQAFYKCQNITVTFEEGLTTIGDEAFYYSMNSTVYLPSTVTSIGTDSFYTLDASCVVYCYSGTYAETYAIENGLTYIIYGASDSEDDPEAQTSESSTSNGTTKSSESNGTTKSSESNGAAVGTKVTVSGLTYKVISSDAVTLTGTSKKNASKVTIPANVKINGKSYKVTQIAASAFAKNKKLKTVVIGKNVKKIGKKAFYNCSKLKNITFKGKNVTSIGAKAFKGTAKKATVKVPKAKKAAYKKLLKKAGLASSAKIK